MKQYHTQVLIAAPPARVWAVLTDFGRYSQWNPLIGQLEGESVAGGTIQLNIVPLRRSFGATFTTYEEPQALAWRGVQGGRWLLSGLHYYQLEGLPDGTTLLRHGEYFTGLLSYLLPSSLLTTMKNTFVAHNIALKQRVEHE